MFTHRNETIPKVFIIHENEEWTAPLITALESRYSVFGLEHVHSHT